MIIKHLKNYNKIICNNKSQYKFKKWFLKILLIKNIKMLI